MVLDLTLSNIVIHTYSSSNFEKVECTPNAIGRRNVASDLLFLRGAMVKCIIA